VTALMFHPVLAEIADKMPGAGAIWVFSCVLGLICVWCCRVSKWLYLLMVPVAGFWAFSGWREFVADSYFHDAVVIELGRGYLIQAVASGFAPLAALLACAVLDLARMRAGHQDFVP